MLAVVNGARSASEIMMKPECQMRVSRYKQGFALKRFSGSRVSPAAGFGMKGRDTFLTAPHTLK